MRRVTAVDVARAAGVSRTTVSFVINRTPGQVISEDTRRRVMDAVRQLGYVPNPTAQALRRGRNGLVVFVLPNLPLASTIAGVVDAAGTGLAQRSLSLLIRRLTPGTSVADLWRELSPSAVIVIDEIADAEEIMMREAGVVMGALLLEPPAELRSSVVFPQAQVGRMQVEHLAAGGCERIVYLAPDVPGAARTVDLRIDGARRACADRGLHDVHVVHTESDAAAMLPHVEQWSRPARRMGVAAHNDQLGGAVLTALSQLGRRAPDDLAVIGCGNDAMSAFTGPPLTTIDHRPQLGGMRLAAIVADDFALGGEAPVAESIVPVLVVRSSS